MKKQILLVVAVLASTLSSAQQIQWMSLEEAIAAQKITPKKIFMDVYTDWCGPCKLLDKKTFQNPDVSKYISEHYYAVKFNAEGQEEINFFNQTYTNPSYDPNRKGRNGTHQFTQYLGVKGYPTMVFFSENGAPIMPVVGYLKPQQLELYLKMIKQGDYQVFSKPEDFEKYQKSFIPRFRG
ncbi:MAG: thioredoxin fold domain-containing protein [Polaribacter sp.]|jgi:thioredoxin-related protein|nr:thioredoxin fold domain-containing protein [Flavobacteriaceae bacterium]MDB2340118.1 thioredoxin fold domain-containing protein [Flavobacteriaceae bacterium]MDB2342483.1 thioredoxin fold domain-containing protein [Flavobacteriaceae bacterium]MDC1031245.1 thioredoxin fold domain-containing protein [Flavobacteriaceae bacterium]